jgi:hypothetical protein
MTWLGLAIRLTLVIISETAHYLYKRHQDKKYIEKLEKIWRDK